MKRMPIKITVFMIAIAFCTGVALAQYAVCPPAKIGGPVEKSLSAAFCNYQSYMVDKKKEHLDKAKKLLEGVLKKEADNPIALNNLAAIMVAEGKLDKADTYLKKALKSLKAKPCLVRLNRVCAVNNICVAVEPVEIGGGNQDLEPMVKFNLEMVKDMMARLKSPKAQ
ncbi:MAG: tetratricopeptide repeat protein [Deltaproteobacteria bacterium]|nr:tetratricopeptide repeat protein [Deltaproteobacteria bacterium]MBW1951512.1 tetratricopeptide repeat protein [Deltaproteobacteria bacterium]MBW1987431.1 tetratricopeptide repeat protein [Deltaproteobacteria bacterium]MBW2135501.1 tetratricopeptide repeat protein [Deltaproteobacteria bacterium]